MVQSSQALPSGQLYPWETKTRLIYTGKNYHVYWKGSALTLDPLDPFVLECPEDRDNKEIN